MSGESIKVLVRFRGNEKAIEQNNLNEWTYSEDSKTIKLPEKLLSQKSSMKETYTFDYIMKPDCQQQEMYLLSAQETVTQFMNGYNGTIFAYGQSGSGKTFSMLGPDEVVQVIQGVQENEGRTVPSEIQNLYGIIPRAIFDIFQDINKQIETVNCQFEIKVNYFEIYQEQINNLLVSNNADHSQQQQQQPQQGLKLREQKNGSVIVMNADPIYVSNPEDIFQLLMYGQSNRNIASTGLNERSSRSHTIFIVEYTAKNPDGSVKQAQINFVDLAGSERIAKTGATGKNLEEAKKINLSLTTLGQCIKHLTEGKSHIPFRDSKLTFFLKQSLGGNSKTTLICTCSSNEANYEETIQTMKFASRAKKIKNKAISNIIKSPQELEQIIQKLKIEIFSLKQQLIQNGIVPMLNYNALEITEGGEKGKDSQQEINSPSQTQRLSEQPIGGSMSTTTTAANLQNLDQHDMTLDLTTNIMGEKQSPNDTLQNIASELQIVQSNDFHIKYAELKAEFDYYKDYAQNKIRELEDLNDRIKSVGGDNKSPSKLQIIIQDYQEEARKNKRLWEKEKRELQMQIFSLERNIENKDKSIKQLESMNEELRKKLERAGMDIFQAAKNKVFLKNASQLMMKGQKSNNNNEDGQQQQEQQQQQQEFIGRVETLEEMINEINSINDKNLELQAQKMNDQSQELMKMSQYIGEQQKIIDHKQNEIKSLNDTNNTLLNNIQSMQYTNSSNNNMNEQFQQNINTPVPQKTRKSSYLTQNQQIQKQNSEKIQDSNIPVQSKAIVKEKNQYLSKFISSSTTQTQSSLANIYQQQSQQLQQVQKQVIDIMMDNLKLVQINNRLITYIKNQSAKTEPKIEEFSQKVAKLESEIQDLLFQKEYLEQTVEEKCEQTRQLEQQCFNNQKQQEQEKYQLQVKYEQQAMKLLDLESVINELEETNQQMKKLNFELKKEKNLIRLDQEKAIKDSAQQIAKQQKYDMLITRFNGALMRQGLEIITKKVEFNSKFFSGQTFSKEEKKLELRRDEQINMELNNSNLDFKNSPQRQRINTFLPNNGSNSSRMQSFKQSRDEILNSSNILEKKLARALDANISMLITKVNPEHDGIIKSLSSKKDNLKELNELLSEDSNEDNNNEEDT